MAWHKRRYSAAYIALLAAGLLHAAPAQRVAATREVWRNLLEAAAEKSRPQPTLRILDAEKRRNEHLPKAAAWFHPPSNTVFVDQELIDLCGKQPSMESCLAQVLGHEASHYYRNHGWGADFASQFAALDAAAGSASLRQSPERMAEMEAEADYFGGILGFLAGYDTPSFGPAAMETIYRAYGLGENLRGYPSLADRKAILTGARDRLRKWIPAFRAGNFFLAAGEFRAASICLEAILQDYPGVEVANNAGVAAALTALSLQRPQYDLPWLIDLNTRLTTLDQPTRGEVDLDEYEEWLRRAQAHFEGALLRKPGYPAALLNLGSLALARNDPAGARRYADSAVALDSSLSSAAARLTRPVPAQVSVLKAARPRSDRMLSDRPESSIRLPVPGSLQPATLFFDEHAFAFVFENRSIVLREQPPTTPLPAAPPQSRLLYRGGAISYFDNLQLLNILDSAGRVISAFSVAK